MKILLLSLFAFIILDFLAQQFCGTDELHYQLYAENPGISQKVIDNNEALEKHTASFVKNHLGQSRAVNYTIPVVFHIIHNYGEENISDAQIYDQMRIINEDFQKRNADTANIIQAFKGIAADCELEFKLAKKDPNGNCTNGINRIADQRTYVGDHSVKDIIQWDPSMYLNIYVCAEAAGLAGHALLPAAADTISQWDGIVIVHSSVGEIGTGNTTSSVVLTHEIGHYLNLQHIWGGNNVPNYPYLPVNDAGNCAYDDGVADTPNTIGWSSCNLNHQSCGSLDNIQNFMEYAYCPAMLTEGQKARMHATLNSPIANRNNLWSAANLIATGVNESPTLCKTDFIVSDQLICAGETLTFADASYNFSTQWSWEFSGGQPATSMDSMVNVTYNTPGTYAVKLVSGDGTSTDSIEKLAYIKVLPSSALANSVIEGFEAATDISNTQLIDINPDGQNGFYITSDAGSNSSKSIRLDHLNNLGKTTEIIQSERLDLSAVNDLILSFDYAYAKTSAISQDKLFIEVSSDCGENWNTRGSLSSSTLNTNGDTLTSDYIPDDTHWETRTVTNIGSSYWTDNFMFRLRFEGIEGNHLYLDNINLLDPNMASIEEGQETILSVFPNPTSDQITVVCPSVINGNLSLSDVNGRVIFQSVFNENLEIPVSNYASGCYIISVKTEDSIYRKRIIIE